MNAIRMLTDFSTNTDAIRIKLAGILRDPKAKPKDINMAIKYLNQLEGEKPKTQKKEQSTAIEDEHLTRKMLQLENAVTRTRAN